MTGRKLLWAWALLAAACAAPTASVRLEARCGDGRPLKVHVFDVKQGSSTLIELPDGRALLIDAGGQRNGTLADAVARYTAGRRLAVLWITHPHADHLQYATSVLEKVGADLYVDDGWQLEPGSTAAVVRAAAVRTGSRVASVTPASPDVPLEAAAPLKLSSVVPREWPNECRSDKPNNCSAGIRIDYCASSVLITGDAEAAEEAVLTGVEAATLLIAGHHGSGTSSSPRFLQEVRPKYVVISAGKNETYCHPNEQTVQRISQVLDGAYTERPSGRTVEAGKRELGRCSWTAVPRADNLYSTRDDGDVHLVTVGDGEFSREAE